MFNSSYKSKRHSLVLVELPFEGKFNKSITYKWEDGITVTETFDPTELNKRNDVINHALAELRNQIWKVDSLCCMLKIPAVIDRQKLLDIVCEAEQYTPEYLETKDRFRKFFGTVIRRATLAQANKELENRTFSRDKNFKVIL